MATVAFPRDTNAEFVEIIASEVASGIDAALDHWMAQINVVFQDPQLTTLGRMHAIKDILDRYKRMTGKFPPAGAAIMEQPGHGRLRYGH